MPALCRPGPRIRRYKLDFGDSLEEIRRVRLFGTLASGNTDRFEGSAEQCVAEYDLDGWHIPDLTDPGEFSYQATKGAKRGNAPGNEGASWNGRMNVHDKRAAVDGELFRRVMGRFTTGVTVITADAEGAVRGMTANAFMSGSLAPPLCIIAIAKKARMHAVLANGRHFGVSMLAQGQEPVSQYFAGQGAAQPDLCFEHISGVPVLAKVSAAIAASIEAQHDCGDHTIFIGRIISLRDGGRPPLVYHSGKYASLHYKETISPNPVIDFWELPPDSTDEDL